MEFDPEFLEELRKESAERKGKKDSGISKEKLAEAMGRVEAQESLDSVQPIQTPGKGFRRGVNAFTEGLAGGVLDVVHGAGNMLGLISDDQVAEHKKRFSTTDNTLPGKAGDFVGESVALGAALGKVGASIPKAVNALKGTQLAGSADKALRLSKATQAIANKTPKSVSALKTTAKEAAEGAAGAAVLAAPGERGEAAVQGGVAGAALERLGKGVGSVWDRGLAQVSPQARQLRDYVKKETGTEPFIPFNLAAEARGGRGSAAGAFTGNRLMDATYFMGGHRNMRNQIEALRQNVAEADLMKAFPDKQHLTGQLQRKAVLDEFHGSGDVRKAVEAGVDQRFPTAARGDIVDVEGRLTLPQAVLRDAGKGKPFGRYSPEDLSRADLDTSRKFTEALRRNRAGEGIEHAKTTSGRAKEGPYRDIANLQSQLLNKPAAMWASSIPAGGPVARNAQAGVLSSEKFQRWMMGDTERQRRFAAGDTSSLVREFLSLMRTGSAANIGEIAN